MLGIPFLDDAINKWFRPQQFDDPVDRLNYFVTATLLAFFATMVSAKQYVGSPIQCWMPTEFKGGWEQYVEDYCFIQNTYYVPLDREIPVDHEERREKEFGYYQWVPIILALQAIMFYIPNWLWKTLHQQSGLDLRTAIADAAKLRAMRHCDRNGEVEKLCTYISETLEINEGRPLPRRVLCFRIGRHLGSYVSTLYIFIKLLYVLNIFLQFVILNNFLGTPHSFWGLDTMLQLIQGQDWTDTHVFPRVTLCDFQVRRLANLHNYTVQCVLMINMFNEKIYLFIWFWFAFVLISTVINFFYTLVTLVPPGSRERKVFDLLNQHQLADVVNTPETKNVVRRFANSALCPDVVLLLRFVEGHAGAIVARDIAAKLFYNYCQSTLGQDLSGTKSTSPGTEDFEYPTKHLSPPYKAIPEEARGLLEQPDASTLPKHKHV
uniref:Innexin n=1 Tax=Panagrolaimus sp. JU765 TaxID=591449 RepID=A0AC34RM35_9BILA